MLLYVVPIALLMAVMYKMQLCNGATRATVQPVQPVQPCNVQ